MTEYRIADVADLLGLSAALLRSWTFELAAYLSDTAQWITPNGRQRPAPRYTDHDIVVLCQAQRQRERGRSFEQIRAQLAEQAAQSAEIDLLDLQPAGMSEALRPPQHAYELAVDALHDALRMQGALVQRLQEEIRQLRAEHDQLARAHAAQRSHYLAIIRVLLGRTQSAGHQREVGV